MSHQPDSVLSAIPKDGKPHLVPVADLLSDPFRELDWDYVFDTRVDLVYDPDQNPPYQVRVDYEIDDATDDLARALVRFRDTVRELIEAAKEAKALRADRRRA